jgi:ribosome-associated translation inhibitor RaiA
MQRPLEIRFRQMDPSPAIEARIREKAAALERFSERITGCRVIVEQEHRHHRQGNLFRVRVEIDAPGRELAATHTGPKDHAHENVQVAIRDAFNAAVLSDGRLTIKGEKKQEKEEKKKDYHMVERSYGSFARSIALPFEADPGQVKASFAKGVLTVTLPKPPQVKAKEKKIPIGKG